MATPAGRFARFSAAFDRGFERLRAGYSELLTTLLRRRFIVPVVAVLHARSRRDHVGRLSVVIFSRSSMAARSSFTFARPPEPGSRPPSGFSRLSRTRSARSFLKATAN